MNPSTGLAQDLTQTITADSTMDGNAGVILRVVEYGYSDNDVFTFEEAGKYRVYAVRDYGSQWEYMPPEVYYCPVSSMTIGETWRHVGYEGEETQATVALQEQVTTAAGTFSCYKIDIHVVSNPGAIVQTLWLSSGVGLVKEGFFDASGYWIYELTDYSVSGTGFIPGDVGNIWNYSSSFVGTTETSWGAIKSMGR
jgi:hypothetical protein